MLQKQKYIIDTDLGDDIDDVLALALAMRQNMELVGITTVFRNVEDRARLAKKLLLAFGAGYEQIPVLCGHSRPMDKKTPSAAVNILTEEERRDPMLAPAHTDPQDAIQFLIDACHTYGEQLTVVALGPLTNLARVIEQDPLALSHASRVTMMGGAFFRHYVDWNVMCDPQAAAIVFSSLSNLECVGADVTHQTVAPPTFETALFHPAVTAASWQHLLAELSLRWLQARAKPQLVLHDPLCIAALLDPFTVTFTETSILVLTEGPARGLTLNVDAYEKQWMNDYYRTIPPLPRHRVACAVDLSRFWEQMQSVLHT